MTINHRTICSKDLSKFYPKFVGYDKSHLVSVGSPATDMLRPEESETLVESVVPPPSSLRSLTTSPLPPPPSPPPLLLACCEGAGVVGLGGVGFKNGARSLFFFFS